MCAVISRRADLAGLLLRARRSSGDLNDALTAQDQDEFSGQPDYHPPGKAEDRIDQLFRPYTQKLGRKIDMIQLHSGSASSGPGFR